jgi:PPM family protein phosphatase
MLQVAMITNKGGRRENEDFCGYKLKEDFGCFLVADGLGGHRGGAQASSVTGQSILDAFNTSPGATEDHLAEYLQQARSEFQKLIGNAEDTMAPRTTLSVLLTDENTAIWAHIGDTRLYHFRKRKILFQTLDHSVPQQLVNCGEISQEEVRDHEDRNRLIAVFDGKDINRIEYSSSPVLLMEGDAFLLCSDGFWEYVLEAEMEKCMKRSKNPDRWLSLMKKRLLKRAKKNHDNYTALAVFINGKKSFFSRFKLFKA